MMRKEQLVVFCLALMFLTSSTHSQFPLSPCTSTKAREFDFWIGDWSIKQKMLKADGAWFESKARTKVTRQLDGCTLLEQWEGEVLFFWEGMTMPEKLKGLSVRSYDEKLRQWHIQWMDSRNPQFASFVGNFNDGTGEFYRTAKTTDTTETTIRIRFSDITQSSVRWELAARSAKGETFSTLWIMEMTKKQ